MKEVKVSASVLSSDFTRVAETVRELERAGADYLHLDVMDGNFVPNISFGAKMCADIAKITKLPLDIHLMIERPSRYIDEFAKAEPEIITVHYEAAAGNLDGVLEQIRELGIKAGVSLRPRTSVKKLKPYLEYIGLILIMSVEPGYGGRQFIHASLNKIEDAVKLADKRNVIIECDGGIKGDNVKPVIDAGADLIVSGSYITGAVDKAAAVRALRG